MHSFGRADQLDRDDRVRLCTDPSHGDAAWRSGTFPMQNQRKALTVAADLPGDIQIIRTLDFGCVMVVGR
ncbi:MAG: hypothetical protein HY881_26585 [Deltaproteobacteria bacterium]|nr:hypothetical protein [Deltaproteobacteria bacterium]